MKVTIKKISEMAGVSIGTVDRALHGRKGINPAVAERIVSIADSLGYKPNIMAKALALKRRQIKIGVVFHNRHAPFFKSVADGIQAATEESIDFGISVEMRYSKNFDVEDQLKVLDELVSDGISAIALVPPLNDVRISHKISEISKKGIPVMLLVSDLDNPDRLAYVGSDSFHVGRIAGGLIGLLCNHKGKVVYTTPYLSTVGNTRRLDGFKDALNERFPDINLIKVSEYENDDILSYKQAIELFRNYNDIDAIMIANSMVHGILEAIKETTFPRPIKIVTLDIIDDIKDCMNSGLITSTIEQHPFEQGYAAIKHILDYFIYGTIPDQEECYIPCSIRIYESIF